MLLSELVKPVSAAVLHEMSTDEIARRTFSYCGSMNWQYDINPFNERVFDEGDRNMRRIEEHFSELFKRDRILAMSMWQSQCPFAVPGIAPRFL